jgi:hypothetical protein
VTTALPSQRALSRRVVRNALSARPWVEPLVLAFAPVFALLAVVSPPADGHMRSLWATLSSAAGVVAAFSFVEQRRRVSLVLDLCNRRLELAEGRLAHEGVVLHADTALRYYPLRASLLFIEVQSATCPSCHRRRGAQALSVAVNLLLGWWSPVGLLTTPFLIWRCARGGETTTPAALLEAVDVYVKARPTP